MKKTGLEALAEALNRTQGSGRIGPAKAEDLKSAKDSGFPQVLLDFYATSEPDPSDGCVELEQRLYCIADAIQENTEYGPGNGLAPHGYVVFASTGSGDAYCIDTNVSNSRGEHPVALFGHEVINESSSLDYIKASRVEVATSLDDFLLKFAAGELSEDAHYPPRFKL